MTNRQKYYFLAIFFVGLVYIVTKKTSFSQKVIPEKSGARAELATIDDSSRYMPYTLELFKNSKEKRRVLYFYANWCITCKPANADFLANEDKIPEDVEVLRVNFKDSETDQEEANLAKKYNIVYQHTFVQVDSDDKEIKKWNGGDSKLLIENLAK